LQAVKKRPEFGSMLRDELDNLLRVVKETGLISPGHWTGPDMIARVLPTGVSTVPESVDPPIADSAAGRRASSEQESSPDSGNELDKSSGKGATTGTAKGGRPQRRGTKRALATISKYLPSPERNTEETTEVPSTTKKRKKTLASVDFLPKGK